MRAKKYPKGLYVTYTNTYDNPCLVQNGHDSSYAVHLYTYEEINKIVTELTKEVEQLNSKIMKRFVVIRHERAIENVVIPVNCSELFDNVLFERFLSSLHVNIYNIEMVKELRLPNAWEAYRMLEPVDSIEELVKVVKATKLYEKTRTPVNCINKKAEVRRFRMSSCFIIDDVSRSSVCTFFKVSNDPESIKDIMFDDESLLETLECKISKNHYYYLRGDWHFFRSTSNPTVWEARLYKVETVDYIEGKKEITH